MRREVRERTNVAGKVVREPALEDLDAIVAYFREHDIEAVAVCFLHAYANADNERIVAARLRELMPEAAIVASHEISREWREYERTSTTVLSAYVAPVVERYVGALQDKLGARGMAGAPYIMQSNGGVATAGSVRRNPITMVESGPAAGIFAAASVGRLIGEPNLLVLDIGGTTAKCSLIEDGQVKIMTDYWIERDRKSAGYPIMVPVVDLVEIGNGGGSIAWVDEHQKLHVGPQSAGASPGPAAYGRGGDKATTTDANLWLGRINRDYFCGGEVVADMAATEKALTAVGGKLGISPDEAARGIIRIANNNMVNALKLVSLNRGHDPRDFTLVAFGGGGAMHAVALGMELGVKKVVIPTGASVFSAWGMMMSDLRRDYFVTRLGDLRPGAAEGIEKTFAEGEAHARAQFAAEGIDPAKVKVLRFGKFRYQNQEHTTEVLIDGPVTEERLAAIEADFHQTYEREYTYRLKAPVEIVGIHLVASAEVGKLTMEKRASTGTPASSALKGERNVDYALEGIHKAAIYDGTRLEPGMTFAGPAIIEDPGTTVVIHPGNRVEIANAGARLVLRPDWPTVTWTETERKKGQAWGLKTIETFHTHGTPPVKK